MDTYKFETTVLKDGMIKIPQLDKFKDKQIEVFIVLKPQKNKKNERKITFEEWNKQFKDCENLDNFIPEYNRTLRQFRMDIFESEFGQEITKKELKESLKNW